MSQDAFGPDPAARCTLQSVGWTGIDCLLTQGDALQGPLKHLCALRPRMVSAFLQGAEPRLHMPTHILLVQHKMERDCQLLPVQGYADLVIITEGPQANARAPCTMSLLAKDGVYLMQIPRQVDDLVLAAGNRCDITHHILKDVQKPLLLYWNGKLAVARALPRQLHHGALQLKRASQTQYLDRFDAGLRCWCSAMEMWGTAITLPPATSVLLAQGTPICRHPCIPCAALHTFTGAPPA